MRFTVMAFALVVASFTASHAIAQDDALRSDLEAYVVTTGEDGVDVFTAAETIKPGGVIEYRIVYENLTDGPLNTFVVNGPIPESTAFISGSNRTSVEAVFEVEVPDLGWSAAPVYRTTVSENGVETRERVPASEFTNVRWALAQPLDAGQSVQSIYRVQVDN